MVENHKLKIEVGVVIALLFVILISLVSAQEYPCVTDEDCPYIEGENSYCDLDSGLCVIPEATVTPTTSSEVFIPPASSPPFVTADNAFTNLQLQIDTLRSDLDTLSVQVENGDSQTQAQLQSLEATLKTLSIKIDELKKKDLGKFSTGLAGMQEGLKNATEEVGSLKSKASQAQFLSYFILLVVIASGGAGVAYYLKRLEKLRGKTATGTSLTKESYHYINKLIKNGKKFPQIKEKLAAAGWSEEEIEKAYQATTRHNYRKYLQGHSSAEGTTVSTIGAGASYHSSSRRSTGGAEQNKVKAIAIAGVSLILIIGVLFLLRGTTGKAIHFERLVDGSVNATSGELTYTVECTPPHMLTPEKTSCCLDNNTNALCDDREISSEQNKIALEEGKKCRDNKQCGNNLCLNQQCTALSSIYHQPLGSGACSKVCNFYVVEILTSDGETYTVKPKEGSYTAAGALDWTILSAPDHCLEESAIVPIKITRKKPGKIINEEIISLGQGQSSKALTHPYVPNLMFTLKVKKAYELCGVDANDLRTIMEKQSALETALRVK